MSEQQDIHPQEQNKAHKTTRRKFLIGLGAATGLYAAKALNSDMETKGVGLEEIEVGNLRIVALSIEHTKPYWDVFQDSIRSLIKSSEIVIPEYFLPGTYNFADDPNPAIARYGKFHNDVTFLFQKVEEEVALQKKTVWHVDALKGREFVSLRAGLMTADVAVDGTLTYPLASALGALIFNKDGSIPRRSIVNSVVAFTTGAIAQTIAEGATFLETDAGIDLGNNLEKDIRRTIVAESLVRLGNDIPGKTPTLLIYPEAHMRAIKFYVQNPDERKRRMKIYNSLRETDYFKPLFEANKFVFENQNWEKKETL